jgi:hypothetical protein
MRGMNMMLSCTAARREAQSPRWRRSRARTDSRGIARTLGAPPRRRHRLLHSVFTGLFLVQASVLNTIALISSVQYVQSRANRLFSCWLTVLRSNRDRLPRRIQKPNAISISIFIFIFERLSRRSVPNHLLPTRSASGSSGRSGSPPGPAPSSAGAAMAECA